MKVFTKLILIILFILLSLVTILVATIKFQFLDTNFWKSTFKSNNVYVNLSVVIKTAVGNQTEKGGGKKSDLKVLTDVITPEILEDVVSRNLDNILNFANGKRKELLVYIPKVIDFNSEELPLTALLSKFNIAVGKDLPLSQIVYLGLFTNYLFFGLLIICSIFIILLYKIKALGWGLIFSGGFILLLSLAGFLVKDILFNQIILTTFMPYILQEVLKIWTIVGIIMLILGTILFFVKKPNDSRQI